MSDVTIPRTQYAVQLVGASELKLNTAKEVFTPGRTQILLRVEATSLCFSDLKLLKQFTGHVRKGELISGLSPEVMKEIPSYVPGSVPTVPGHETVGRIVAVGEEVKRYKVNERVLVQADWRELRTAHANGAFGYNFEGGLQEYVLLDERIVVEPATGDRYLLPVGEQRSASAIALVEPWSCVEDSYVTHERRGIKPGGRLLVAAEADHTIKGLTESFAPQGKPASVTVFCPEDSQADAVRALGIEGFTRAEGVDSLQDEGFDDIVYFGTSTATVEALGDKLASRGIFNIVAGEETFGGPVSVDVGRIHYGLTRWTGTTGDEASDGYKRIPEDGRIRDDEKILVIGAGGPMGQMHVIRALCTGRKNVSLVATDFDTSRLESLGKKAFPLSRTNGVDLRLINPQEETLDEKFTYIALMAPLPQLVAQGIIDSAAGGVINIFAGIPAGKHAELDLDTYIANQLWLFGTSGSTIRDMKLVLQKVESGQLDTDLSVDAVAGMAGAIDGIAAVENRTLSGKIVVYPTLHEVGLIPLAELDRHFPSVAEKLDDGSWTRAAEEELLKVAAGR